MFCGKSADSFGEEVQPPMVDDLLGEAGMLTDDARWEVFVGILEDIANDVGRLRQQAAKAAPEHAFLYRELVKHAKEDAQRWLLWLDRL
jgi:hypothetical protein